MWRRRVDAEVAEGAEIEWDRLGRAEPDLVQGLDLERFRAVYAKVMTPRGPLYMLMGAAAIVAATPLIFMVMSGAIYLADMLGLTPERFNIVGFVTVEDGVVRLLDQGSEIARYWNFSIVGFALFFGLIIAWVAIASLFARAYWRRLPGSLREEIIRAR